MGRRQDRYDDPTNRHIEPYTRVFMKFDCPSWPPEWPEIRASINQTIDSGNWGSYRSDQQEQLKTAISATFSASHVRLCCSGTAAIEIALKAAGVRPGHEVILAALDYPGNFRTIELVGARPVLVDVDQTLSIDPKSLAAVAAADVRAVIASHIYGNAADIKNLKSECDRRGWVLIEDACQVPGMTIGGAPAGSIGHLGTLSFGGSKPLTAGSGGAILTNESRFAVKIDSILDRPSDASPLSPLQAAALLPQLQRLQECNQRRVATVRHLESKVISHLARWLWLSQSREHVEPAYYKVAWAAQSAEHRAAIIDLAAKLGLPIGEGFRSMVRSSERRCRKPVALHQSTRLGETIFVLDHAALLIREDRYRELGDMLQQLEQHTR